MFRICDANVQGLDVQEAHIRARSKSERIRIDKLRERRSFAILTRTSNSWMFVNVFIVVYVQEMDAKRPIRSCIGCARRKFQNFAIFGAKHPLTPMAFKHFTPNFGCA